MKKKSLARQFSALFIVFALATILVSGVMTFINQTNEYHGECVRNLEQLTTFLSELIGKEGDDFANIKGWYASHPGELEIPRDFFSDLPVSREKFYDYLKEHYNGRTYGSDLFFADLDEEGQRLCTVYRFEHWFSTFFDATKSFNLSYVYFIYPEEGKDHIMNYMYDATLETTTGKDGSEILKLGDQIYEDPNDYKYMWQAWETGKAPSGFDSTNNQFGYVYTYSYPIVIDGNKVGVLCADISVDAVKLTILSNVASQTLVSMLVVVIGTIILFYFLRSRILKRIFKLEEEIAKYTGTKDPTIAKEILANKGWNDEIGSLSEGSAGMITELEEHMRNLQKITAERERISAELGVATQIQADMLPRIFPAFPQFDEFELYASMDPAKEVGGDFYDFFMVDDRHLALVIADVSGKGVPAALFMVIAKTLIKNRLQMGEEPAVAIGNVNEQLCEGNDAGMFVTVWTAVIDILTGDGVEVNAGHEYPAVYRKGGKFELIKTKHSPAVAVMEGMRFKQSEFHLDPGDMVFMYTDGATEATNAENQLFGEQRLTDALNRHLDLEPKDLLPAMRKEIDAFVADAPQFDDLTMLCMTFRGKKQ